jgi:hypothetical protein
VKSYLHLRSYVAEFFLELCSVNSPSDETNITVQLLIILTLYFTFQVGAKGSTMC